MPLTMLRMPAEGRSRTESGPAAADLPARGDAQLAPTVATLAEPPVHRRAPPKASRPPGPKDEISYQ